MKWELYILYLLCCFPSFSGIIETFLVDNSENMDLYNIRKIVQNNEKCLNLIKLNYVIKYENNELKDDIQFESRKSRVSEPYSHCTGVWAQDGNRLHSSRDYFVDSNTLDRSEITVVDGELMKWAKRPEFMQGAINKVENLDWQNRFPNRLGIRPFEGELLLSELLVPEYAIILEKETIFNNQSTSLIEVKRHTELVYYARVWIDKERGIPLRYVYFMKLDSNKEDVLAELLITKTYSLSNGGVLPVETKRTRYSEDEEKHTLSTVDVNSISFKREDIPESLFEINFPVGAKIFNAITGITTIVAPTLSGKSLPRFEAMDITFTTEEIKDKKLLICFFDMDQRPSRNCILQLNTRAQELRAKDVVIVAVQASKIEQAMLDEWIKENDVTFPVGMIQGDSEKIRFTWGVKSLPWLILTDKKNIVTAEGFSLDELDEKLKL